MIPIIQNHTLNYVKPIQTCSNCVFINQVILRTKIQKESIARPINHCSTHPKPYKALQNPLNKPLNKAPQV